MPPSLLVQRYCPQVANLWNDRRLWSAILHAKKI
jgi:hypothetical protein